MWSVCGMCLDVKRWASFFGKSAEAWLKPEPAIVHPGTRKQVRGRVRYASGYEVNLDQCSGTVGEQVD